MRYFIIFVLTSFLFLSFLPASGNSGAVSSAEKSATKVGIEILKNGGNAFDATVAVGFALAVTHPNAGNIGGGGFVLYSTSDKQIGAIDFREVAPLASFKNMYLDSAGAVIKEKSLLGPVSSGVPGTVAGLFDLHERFGKLTWKECLRPGINLAAQGIIVDQYLEDRLEKYDSTLSKFPSTVDVFFKNGQPLLKGDRLIQLDLAKTLKAIADQGKAGFYDGWVADSIVQYMVKTDGLISHEDLRNYQPEWRKVDKLTFNGFHIYTMPLPSSAYLVIRQILSWVEPHLSGKSIAHNSSDYIHLLVEAEKRAFADRNYFLGDPDFVPVPTEILLDRKYLDDRLAQIPQQATPAREIFHGIIEGYEHEETTHFSIVDRHGNAVACTYTLNGNFGSKAIVPGTGFLINNEMDDFTVKPGSPNLYGLVQSSANAIEPGKRMLSSMSPTIVFRNDSLYFMTGSPGGSTILTTVLQTLLNACYFDFNGEKTVESPRFHHQLLPDSIYLERALFFKEDLKRELRSRGHHITLRKSLGEVNAIKINNGVIEAISDSRGRGYGEVY